MTISKWITKDRLFLIVMLLAVFMMAARTPLDSDLWWHLRAGEVTWETRKPLLEDAFSYTRLGERWINHSWLAQVIFYLVYRLGNLRAISAFVAVLAVVSLWMVDKQFGGGFPVRALVLLFVALTSSVVWSPRPQTISLVFFSMVGYILYLYKWQDVNKLGWLIPLFVVWSNIHAGYVLGLILIAVMIAGELFNRITAWERGTFLSWHEIRILAVMFVIAGAVVVINPNGLAMWQIPFQTVGVETLQNLISEWSSPDFHAFYQQPFIWLSLLTVAAVGLSDRKIDGSELAAFSAFFYAALIARRNFGPFALVAGPIMGRHLSALLDEWQDRAKEHWEWFGNLLDYRVESEQGIHPGLQGALNAFIVILLAAAGLGKWIYVTRPGFIERAEREVFPVEAVAWIKEHQPQGRMFNEYNWGGYLIWHLRDYPVFVDGRTDLYGDEILKDYLRIKQGTPNVEKMIETWDIGFFVLNGGESKPAHIKEDWQLINTYNSVLFVKE